MKKYISINDETKEFSDEIHLVEKNNKICGQIESLNKDTNQLEDVRDVFIAKKVLEKISPINTESESGFTMEDLAKKINELIGTLKGDEK